MPICIECCYPVSHLYTSYSKADDRSLGKGVRLTQCPRCQRFADKYVEHDFVVLFIDLVLIKPQVYRHLLFNRLGRDDDKFDRSIIRLGVLTLLFDVYLSWATVERSGTIASSSLSTAHILVQYLFFLTLNTLGTFAHHATVRILAAFFLSWAPKANNSANTNNTNNNNDVPTTPENASPSGIATPIPAATQSQSQMATPTAGNASPTNLTRAHSMGDIGQIGPNLSTATLPVPGPDSLHPPLRRVSTAPISIDPIPPPAPASTSAISTALLVSSCTKLFPILLVIWAGDFSSDTTQANTSRQASTAISTSTNTLAGGLYTAATASSRFTSTFPSLSSSPTSSCRTSSSSSISPQPSSQQIPTSQSWTSSPAVQPFLSLLFSMTPTHLVVLNNIEAIFILLDCGYVRAAAIALGGQFARWMVQKTILSTAGL